MHSPLSSPPRANFATSLLPGFGAQECLPFKIHSDAFDTQNQTNIEHTALLSPLPSSSLAVSSPPAENLSSSPILRPSSPPSAQSRPLQPVAVVNLPLDGTEVLVGRSSKLCKVPLSARNRLISRVHARVWYQEKLVAIECLGPNGLLAKVPFANQTDRQKFTEYEVVNQQCIYVEHCEGIELQIHGERVRIEFDANEESDEATEDEDVRAQILFGAALPLPTEAKISTEQGPKMEPKQEQKAPSPRSLPTQEFTIGKQAATAEMAAPAAAPVAAAAPVLSAPSSPVKRKHSEVADLELERQVINAVAYSRLTSIPFSQIQASSKALEAYSSEEIQATLLSTNCIGVIKRIGKDAMGKLLESEYYYLAENDADIERRELVAQSKGGRRSLRACRRTHKQYFYRKPREVRHKN